jgi:hypothetical protein
MSFADLLTGNRFVRSAAEAFLVRAARKRTQYLDACDPAQIQEETLFRLLRKARHTRFGEDHQFAKIQSISEFQQRVPLRSYEYFWENYWKSTYPVLDNITWPGKIPYYALSSGTTSGATKYIPVSKEMVASNKKAGYTTISFFRDYYPNASIFNGRFFFLGGNTGMTRQVDGSFAGDLSAISAIEVKGLMRPYTFPPLELSRIPDWETKVDALAEAASKLPITAFSGVPAWMLVIFDRLKKITGKSTIAEIWPEFRLLVHGGTKFDPYREVFRKEIGSDQVKFIEVYPCSEGFVATEDPRYELMRIVPDHNIFFEFVPVEDLDLDRPRRFTLRNVEIGVEYAIIVTTCAGLWSYIVGDTIAFEKRNPPLIRFTGRTKYFLSAFGEHLINEEVERAIAEAALQTNSSVVDHHVGPVFSTNPNKPGWHRYLVEFSSPPKDLQQFTSILDKYLCEINEDYCAHRQGDLSMGSPEVLVVKSHGCQTWMRAHGKDFQGKFPRMDNTGKKTEEIRKWMEVNDWLGTSSHPS